MQRSRREPWRTSALGAALLGWFAFAGSVRAQDAGALRDVLGLSGTLRGAYFSREFDFSPPANATPASGWVTAQPQKVWGVGSYFDARVQDQDVGRKIRASWELREGYLERAFDDLDLKAGRQIIVWGRADKVNPTDVWSVRDLKLLTTDDEDQRLGAAAIQASWQIARINLIGVWQPEWRTPNFPVPPLPAGLRSKTIDPHNATAQFGLKLDHSGEGADWSVSYARTIDKVPDLAIEAPGLLAFTYRPMEMFGADAAVPVGRYGLRGEIAYNRTLDRDVPGAAVKHDNLFLVAGVERTIGGELNFNLQYLYRHNFGFQDSSHIADPVLQLLDRQEDVISDQLARDMQGVSVRVVDKFFNETLEGEIAGVAWFGKAGSALRPKLSYAVSDHLKLIVGGQLYFGPKDGFFGQFRDASTAFTELRWGF
jgi:hypothetical protein